MSELPSTIDPTALGMEVPVSEIESRLREFWENDENRTHVSMMNLVVVSEHPGSLLANSCAIRDLAAEHACRAILTELDRGEATASIRAWVTAHCQLFEGSKVTCSEQIAFLLTGTASGRFRNIVFSHLQADLPVVLWWQGELSPIFTERLARVIDRLVVDSATWRDPATNFNAIRHTAEESNPDLILQDFAWTRSWQLRLSVASMFDDVRAQSMLADIRRIEIDYSPSHRNTALQVLCWMAVQAGWKDREDGQPGYLRADGQTIDVIGKQTAHDIPVSRLLLGSVDEFAEFVQTPESGHITRRFCTPGYEVSALSPSNPESPVDLLGEQLSRGGRNSMFRKILPRYLVAMTSTVSPLR